MEEETQQIDAGWNGVGSGSPYFGSGFTNLDRFLSEQNLATGRNMPATWDTEGAYPKWVYESPQTDQSLRTPYDEWIINAGRGPYVAPPPPPEEPPPETPPEDTSVDAPPDYSEDWENSELYRHVARAHENDPNYTGPTMPPNWKPPSQRTNTASAPPANPQTNPDSVNDGTAGDRTGSNPADNGSTLGGGSGGGGGSGPTQPGGRGDPSIYSVRGGFPTLDGYLSQGVW